MDTYFNQIEAFLDGELNSADAAAFEQAMRSNPELKQAVDQQRMLQQRLLGLQMRKKVAAALNDTPPVAPKKNYLGVWITALALAGMALWALWPAQHLPSPDQPTPPLPTETAPSSSPTATPLPDARPVPRQKPTQGTRVMALAQSYMVAPPDELIRATSAKEPSDSPLQKASNAFARGEYALTCTLLQGEILPESSTFLRACACFKIGQYKEASADFKTLENSFQYQYEAKWNRLLCEMALGNQRFVQKDLERMVADKDFPFNALAKRLKKALQQDF